MVGEAGAVFDGQRRLSGFVADVGVLPSSIDELVSQGGREEFAVRSPIFDRDPTDSVNDGTNEVVLDAAREHLLKGYRGPYLELAAGAETFRDGWGNVNRDDPADDDANHGWSVAPSATDFQATSLGADGEPGDSGLSDYDGDLTMEIEDYAWRVDLGGWGVKVTNDNGRPADDLRVSLLVFEDGDWRRLTTSERRDVPGRSSVNLAFGADAGRVPIGEHLVVLVADGDETVHNGEEPYDADPAAGDAARVTERVSFFPRAALPQVELVIPEETPQP